MFPATLILFIFALTPAIRGDVSSLDADSTNHVVEIPRGLTQDEYRSAVIEYWTPERMASAQPLRPFVNHRYQTIWSRTLEAERMMPTDNVEPETRNANTPPAVGRAFFNYGSSRYWCSASVVKAQNQDLLLTAGHCVYNTTTKQYATNWTFVPDYDNQARPFGTFVARQLAANAGWMNNNDWNYDAAIVLVFANANGQHIQQLTGGFDLSLSATKKAMTTAFGFPGNINSGETMSNCAITSESAIAITIPIFNGLRMKCGMAGGSSGGPWVRNYNAANKSGQVVSVVSFSYAFAPGYLYGPYLTTSNIGTLYNKNQAVQG